MQHIDIRPSRRSGFTLIELLLVIAIIAILAAIVIIAINPARQIGSANNAQRRSNVVTILNGVGQYMVDNRGSIPSGISTVPTEICKTGQTTSSCTGYVSLAPLTWSELYLSSVPIDPATSLASSGTGYYISKSTSLNPRITVAATTTDNNEVITVTR